MKLHTVAVVQMQQTDKCLEIVTTCLPTLGMDQCCISHWKVFRQCILGALLLFIISGWTTATQFIVSSLV